MADQIISKAITILILTQYLLFIKADYITTVKFIF